MSIFKRHENLNLAINSAKAIGINVINIDSHIIEEGKRHIILGVIWQIIAIFLFDHMKVQFFPGLISLLRDGETLEDLMKLTPEQLLMRWINFQLERVITYSTGFSRLIAKLFRVFPPILSNLLLFRRKGFPRFYQIFTEFSDIFFSILIFPNFSVFFTSQFFFIINPDFYSSFPRFN